jgi:hypothetical protein
MMGSSSIYPDGRLDPEVLSSARLALSTIGSTCRISRQSGSSARTRASKVSASSAGWKELDHPLDLVADHGVEDHGPR